MQNVAQLVGLKTPMGQPLVPSDKQDAIFSHVADQVSRVVRGERAQSLVVEATAGSGKTTTSVAISDLYTTTAIKAITGAILPRQFQVLFLAFNKSIADELQRRLKQGEAKTLNALGDRKSVV